MSNLLGNRASLALLFDRGFFKKNITFTRASTATRVNARKLIETVPIDTPRLDYDPVTGELKGLLIEEARTNLLQRSEEFDNAYWIKSNATITANATIAPDGFLTADKIVGGDTLINNQINKALSKSGVATTYTFSVFAKKGEWDRCNLYVNDTSSFTNRVQFFADLVGGTVVQSTVSGTFSAPSASVKFIGNDWYRLSVTFTTSTETNITARIYSSDSLVTTGDGTSGIYVWGAQLEPGSFPTSHIPTAGASVTRSADNCYIDGAEFTDFYNPDEGTFLVEFIPKVDITTNERIIEVKENAQNFMVIDQPANQFYIEVADVGQLIGDGANLSLNERHITAVSYSSAVAKFYSDGAQVGADYLTPNLIANPTIMYLDGGATEPISGHIKRIVYFPVALPDADLQLLTDLGA